MVGISVARQFCRNRNITTKTSRIASNRVWMTCSTDSFTKVELSTGKSYLTQAGKVLDSSFTRLFTPSTVSSALAPGASLLAKPAEGWPWKPARKIGRASSRGRGGQYVSDMVVGVEIKKHNKRD